MVGDMFTFLLQIIHLFRERNTRRFLNIVSLWRKCLVAISIRGNWFTTKIRSRLTMILTTLNSGFKAIPMEQKYLGSTLTRSSNFAPASPSSKLNWRCGLTKNNLSPNTHLRSWTPILKSSVRLVSNGIAGLFCWDTIT